MITSAELYRFVDVWTTDLPTDTRPEVRFAITRARYDLGRVVEIPLGSNRGEEIDQYNREAGAPLGSPWCGSAAGKYWRTGGIPVPPGYALCANWVPWAKKNGLWSLTPEVGAMVLYQHGGIAHHIELITRVQTIVLSVGGNTSIETGYSREGIGVGLKIVDPKTDPILGYVLPFPKDQLAAQAA